MGLPVGNSGAELEFPRSQGQSASTRGVHTLATALRPLAEAGLIYASPFILSHQVGIRHDQSARDCEQKRVCTRTPFCSLLGAARSHFATLFALLCSTSLGLFSPFAVATVVGSS
jgi:hypothetical protein